MNWRKSISLRDVINRSIKIFSLRLWSSRIVLAIHDLKIMHELSLNNLSHKSLRWLGVNWLPSFPIKFGLFIEKAMISYAIRWRLVNVFNLICILMRSATLIEKFLILSMVMSIIFAVCYISPIIPSRYFPRPWQINSKNCAKKYEWIRVILLTLLKTDSFLFWL